MIRRFINTPTCIMSKSKSKKANPPSQKSENFQQNEPIHLDKSGNICIRFLAKPGAKQNGITDISTDEVGVQIAAPPTEGEANAELIKYLSKLLGLRKSDVSLDKGSRSRNKLVIITKGASTLESIKETLQKECNS